MKRMEQALIDLGQLGAKEKPSMPNHLNDKFRRLLPPLNRGRAPRSHSSIGICTKPSLRCL
jgi:hypothetical protein